MYSGVIIKCTYRYLQEKNKTVIFLFSTLHALRRFTPHCAISLTILLIMPIFDYNYWEIWNIKFPDISIHNKLYDNKTRLIKTRREIARR